MKKDLTEYRKHPRILELRFSLIHTNFVLEYGMEKTAEIFKSFCDIGGINWTMISGVIGRKEQILEANRNKRLRYRQEVVFMGEVYNEPRELVGRHYLRIARRLIYEYADGMIVPSRFINEQWLDDLDFSVIVAGVDAYKNEIERFLNFLAIMTEVTTGVPVAKTQI